MYREPKTLEIEKKDDDSFEITLFEKMKLSITEDEAKRLMWNLSDKLGYETRSKW